MSAEEPNIVVKEVRGEKKVGFRGMQYIDKPEAEMRELVENLGDAIIAFHDAEENFEGPEKYWHFGRIIEQHTEQGKSSELRELLKYSTLDNAQSYDLQLYHNFYKMFPEGDFDRNYPWALYREMVVSKRLDESKKVYARLQDAFNHSVAPRTYEYRAFLKCDTYGLMQVLDALFNLGSDHTSGLDVEKATEGARRIRIMAGEDPSIVTPERVESIINELDLRED